MRVILLGLAFTYACIVAQATAPLSEGRECTHTPTRCAHPLACVGGPTLKRCKKLMRAGERCQTDPFWVCQQGLVCESNVCKIKDGQPCIDAQEQCESGTSCVLSGDQRLCKRMLSEGDVCTGTPELCTAPTKCVGQFAEKRCKTLMPAGERCETDPFWFCDDGLVCEQKTCRIPSGQSCDGNEENCQSGAVCIDNGQGKLCMTVLSEGQECTNTPDMCRESLTCKGESDFKICKKLMPAGGQCRIDVFWGCEDGLLCEGNTCKIAIGDACDVAEDQCQSGARCTGVSGQRKCSRSLSDGDICTGMPDLCPSPLQCVGRFAEKRCKNLMSAGEQCHTDPFWICKPDLVCEQQKCRIADGSQCDGQEDLCQLGTKCVGTAGQKKCSKMLGEGEVCTGKPELCAAPRACVGRFSEKRCKTLMPVGERCHTDPFWICEKGLVCERQVCKIPLQGACAGNESRCRFGTACFERNGMKKCLRKLGRGMSCGPSVAGECINGSVCHNGKCALVGIPEWHRCYGPYTKCQAGLVCFGYRSRKRCLKPVGEGGVCRSRRTGRLPCQQGLTCGRRYCRRSSAGSW